MLGCEVWIKGYHIVGICIHISNSCNIYRITSCDIWLRYIVYINYIDTLHFIDLMNIYSTNAYYWECSISVVYAPLCSLTTQYIRISNDPGFGWKKPWFVTTHLTKTSWWKCVHSSFQQLQKKNSLPKTNSKSPWKQADLPKNEITSWNCQFSRAFAVRTSLPLSPFFRGKNLLFVLGTLKSINKAPE